MKKIYTYNNSELQDLLKTDLKLGLSEKEAEKRLKKHGMNEIKEEKRQGIVKKFAGQFNDFLIIVLIVAAAISFFVSVTEGGGDVTEPIIILLIVLVNAGIGVFQESRAEKSLDMLKQLSAPEALVLRDGKEVRILAREVAVGDILLISAGCIVAADARIIEAVELYTDESSITGEAEPVNKNADIIKEDEILLGDRKNIVYSATSVVSGHGKAVVYATGMDTEVGKVAGLIIDSDEQKTPLQKRMAEFGKKIGILALLICAGVFLVGVIKGNEPLLMFVTSVSLAVAAIPEGLPAIVTIMLAMGVSELAKNKALVRHLPSVETLGSADVICTDKTGTLTQNKMTVVKTFADDEKLLCETAALCCNEESHNPTENAILNYSDKFSLKSVKRIKEIPFNSTNKKMTVLVKDNDINLVISKGASEVILSKCKSVYKNGGETALDLQTRRKIERVSDSYAEEGLRVIAVSYKKTNSLKITERDMVFCGIFGIEDPPRKESALAVAECKKAGIIPVMITGDHKKTAVAIAKKTNIYDEEKKALTGKELDLKTDEELLNTISDYCVFARVTPQHKVRIVKAWQKRGKIVAMTGDGVNDAPALKQADIGCGLGIAGTDVAKAASDMVLTDDNFATIVKAVKYGRIIFNNIRKTVRFLLSSNTGEIVTIFLGMLIGFPPPLLAIQLLWVNLVTDSLPAIALGIDSDDAGLMDKKTQSGDLFTKTMMKDVLFEGILIGALALSAFYTGYKYYNSLETARSMSFCVLSISQLVHAFNVENEKSIFSGKVFKNKLLIFSSVLGIVMQVLIVEIKTVAKLFRVVPLDAFQWLLVGILSCTPLLFCEVKKYINSKKSEKVNKISKMLFTN